VIGYIATGLFHRDVVRVALDLEDYVRAEGYKPDGLTCICWKSPQSPIFKTLHRPICCDCWEVVVNHNIPCMERS
jgi:hypothetical protein